MLNDLTEEADFFNNFFSQKCMQIERNDQMRDSKELNIFFPNQQKLIFGLQYNN